MYENTAIRAIMAEKIRYPDRRNVEKRDGGRMIERKYSLARSVGMLVLGGLLIGSVVSVEGQDAIPADATKLARDVLELTKGRRAKVVWLRVPPGGSRVEHVTGYWVADKKDLSKKLDTDLMGFDTKEGVERIIVKGPLSCNWPLITYDGSKVIYSDFSINTSFVVNWDGSNKRILGTGKYRYATAYWRDPKTGTEWVYFSLPYLQGGGHDGQMAVCDPSALWSKVGDPAIVRRRLDGKGGYETVWDKTSAWYTFSLSADGTHAGGDFPIWPNCQVADLTAGTVELYGQGCVPNFAPDNSYRFFWFLGSHIQITMMDAGKTNPRTIPINFPRNGLRGTEAWPIRWSSDVEYVTVSGPWSQNGSWAPANVQLGRFNAQFTAFEKWVTLTDTPNLLEWEPYMWVAPTGAVRGAAIGSSVKSSGASAATDTNLVFGWIGGDWNQTPVVAFTPEGTLRRDYFLKLHGQAHLGGNYQMRIRQGGFTAKDTGQYVADRVNKAKAVTISMLMTPGSIEPAGPRQIMALAKEARQSFILAQHKGDLGALVRIGSAKPPAWYKLCKLTNTEPAHVTLVIADGQLKTYLNAKLTGTWNMGGNLADWACDTLWMGSDKKDEHPWQGELEFIAIQDRALPAAEVTALYEDVQSQLAARKPFPRLVVTAKLLRRTDVIKPETITYAKALALFAYEVQDVVSGSYDKKLLYVFHWTMMDKEVLPIATRDLNKTYKLVLEPFDMHAELSSDCQSNTLPDENIEQFPMFYDVGD